MGAPRGERWAVVEGVFGVGGPKCNRLLECVGLLPVLEDAGVERREVELRRHGCWCNSPSLPGSLCGCELILRSFGEDIACPSPGRVFPAVPPGLPDHPGHSLAPCGGVTGEFYLRDDPGLFSQLGGDGPVWSGTGLTPSPARWSAVSSRASSSVACVVGIVHALHLQENHGPDASGLIHVEARRQMREAKPTADRCAMTHVLFVDDDERVLRGIRRTMRTTHPDWEMSFAGDSEEALQQLEESGADVIVSDAQMPGVDGLALLQLVRMRYPETARIMLTGQVKKEQTYEAVGLVHQFLAKPVPPTELQAAIDRALHLRGLLDDHTLRSVVSRMRALPSQPDVYTRLMRAVRSEDVGLDEIAGIVEENPSVAARVLQLVNSAFFGLPRPTASIKEAVVFIGTKTLRTLVLSVEAFRDLELGSAANGLDPDALQEHAVTTARIAAEIVSADDKEVAYSAGLLHSIGVLVLASQLSDEWGRIVAEAAESQRSLLEVERLVLGVDHGQIAAASAQPLGPSPRCDRGRSATSQSCTRDRIWRQAGRCHSRRITSRRRDLRRHSCPVSSAPRSIVTT